MQDYPSGKTISQAKFLKISQTKNKLLRLSKMKDGQRLGFISAT